jgi:hypothetical protein
MVKLEKNSAGEADHLKEEKNVKTKHKKRSKINFLYKLNVYVGISCLQ